MFPQPMPKFMKDFATDIHEMIACIDQKSDILNL